MPKPSKTKKKTKKTAKTNSAAAALSKYGNVSSSGLKPDSATSMHMEAMGVVDAEEDSDGPVIVGDVVDIGGAKRRRDEEEEVATEPPRRKRRGSEDDDDEPPRRRRADSSDSDSPPRRKRVPSNSSDSDSPPRRKRAPSNSSNSSNSDSDSPPRRPGTKKPQKMSSGHSAGLQTGSEFNKKEAVIKAKKAKEIAKMVERGENNQASTVYRDESGKVIDKASEVAEERR